MTDTLRPRIITVNDFHKALVDAGVIRPDEAIRRIVIDADVDKVAVVMHVERWGDRRMLQVVPTLEGVEIHEVDRPQAGQENKEG